MPEKRYCEMCDRWVTKRECLECGMETRRAVKPAKRPVVLLVRRIVHDAPAWLTHSTHSTEAEAEREWERSIKGQGVTAWSWWGPRSIAEQMLADPNYRPR